MQKEYQPKGSYLGQDKPKHKLQVFGPNFVTTGAYERDVTISPDGKELFFTLQSPDGKKMTIMQMVMGADKIWNSPIQAPFSNKLYNDMEAQYSADGKKIYFTSNRPINGEIAKDFDIWVTEKTNDSWSEPTRLPEPINSPGNEYGPSVSELGNLCFTRTNQTSLYPQEDIYFSKFENEQYQIPFALDSNINSPLHHDYNAFLGWDETFIIFSSSGRKDGLGNGDLYISIKEKDGSWGKAENLGYFVNSKGLDFSPFVSADGKYFFFTSERLNPFFESKKKYDAQQLRKLYAQPKNGLGDIYWMEMQDVLKFVIEN